MLWDHCNIESKTIIHCLRNLVNSDNKSPSHLYLHTDISSVSYNTDDLASFISNCRKQPGISGMSECPLKAKQQSLSNISLQNYTYEFTSTESSKGGTLI